MLGHPGAPVRCPRRPRAVLSRTTCGPKTGPKASGRTLSRVGVVGDPGVDLGPGSFQPRAQLIKLGKFGGWEQSRTDEQLPVDRQLSPEPCRPVRAKAVVGEHKDIGARCSGHRSGDTSGMRRQLHATHLGVRACGRRQPRQHRCATAGRTAADGGRRDRQRPMSVPPDHAFGLCSQFVRVARYRLRTCVVSRSNN
jgi:hypothetical protein